MKNTYRFDVTDTLNATVNYEKLDIEIRVSPVVEFNSCYPFKAQIYVDFDVAPSAAHLVELQNVIANHDGTPAAITQDKINSRTIGFNKMVQMAIDHPLLDRVQTNAYLTSIDNWKNAFLTDGTHENIIAKISQDAASGDFSAYLTTVVNEAGNTAAEFLMGEILLIAQV